MGDEARDGDGDAHHGGAQRFCDARRNGSWVLRRLAVAKSSEHGHKPGDRAEQTDERCDADDDFEDVKPAFQLHDFVAGHRLHGVRTFLLWKMQVSQANLRDSAKRGRVIARHTRKADEGLRRIVRLQALDFLLQLVGDDEMAAKRNRLAKNFDKCRRRSARP